MIDDARARSAPRRARRGDALSAAGDYNRALAYAPDDPELLRIVAGMNRAEARARLMRRAVLALVLMVGLGGLAFVVGRLVRSHPAVGPAPEMASARGGPLVPGSAAEEVASVTVPSATASVSVRPRVMVPATASTHEPPRSVEREVHLDLTPTMGVTVTIDGSPPAP